MMSGDGMGTAGDVQLLGAAPGWVPLCSHLCPSLVRGEGPISHGLSFVPSKRSSVISANLQLTPIEQLWIPTRCVFLREMWGWFPWFPV